MRGFRHPLGDLGSGPPRIKADHCIGFLRCSTFSFLPQPYKVEATPIFQKKVKLKGYLVIVPMGKTRRGQLTLISE